jgi:uncharacterized protein
MRRWLFTKAGIVLATALVTFGCGWAADLPADKYKEWSTEKEVFVPMRDGVHLSTDVFVPKGAAGKLPTVLIRTPYEKGQADEFFLKQGYVVVLQNERGRYFSEGYFKNYLQGASTDGYDAIDWIVKQPWSNGKVGTIGCSSPEEQQWPMAASNHPGHAAMIPAASGTALGNLPDNETRGAFYRGGVPFTGYWAWWWGDLVPSERLLLPPNSTQEQRIRLRNGYLLTPKAFNPSHVPETLMLDPSKYMHLPNKDVLREMGGPLTAFDNYVTWTPGDARWNEVEHIGAGAKPHVPALHVVTWHDPAVGENTRLFKYLQDLGTPNQYLIVGAGPHCSMFADRFSDMKISDLKSISDQMPDLKIFDFASHALDLSNLKFGDLEIGDARYGGDDHGYTKLFLKWFGHWVNGEQNHVTDIAKVQLYVMGQGWISGDRWPLEQTRFTKYYLSGDSASRLRPETGMLSTSLPGRNEKDSYLYDPRFSNSQPWG